MILTTHLFLVPGSEWVRAIHPALSHACMGKTRGDLYFRKLLVYCTAVTDNEGNSHSARSVESFECF